MVVPHPLTTKLVPAEVLVVGSLAATTLAFNVNGVSTSMMAISKSWPLEPYAKLPLILYRVLTALFCWVASVAQVMAPDEDMVHLVSNAVK